MGGLESVQVDYNHNDIWFLEKLTVTIPKQSRGGHNWESAQYQFIVNRWIGAIDKNHGKFVS